MYPINNEIKEEEAKSSSFLISIIVTKLFYLN